MNNDLYKNKYRIQTTRLSSWDYSNSGYYFVTICTKNKKCILGKIIEEKVTLSKIGKVVKACWLQIPIHFNNVKLDEFIIMPNHIHGIIIINKPDNVETRYIASLREDNITKKFGPLEPNSLQTIIHSFKSAVTRWCRKNGYRNFAWQSRFYDHIIRNETTLMKIQEYILNNPLKWELDKENPDNF